MCRVKFQPLADAVVVLGPTASVSSTVFISTDWTLLSESLSGCQFGAVQIAVLQMVIVD